MRLLLLLSVLGALVCGCDTRESERAEADSLMVELDSALALTARKADSLNAVNREILTVARDLQRMRRNPDCGYEMRGGVLVHAPWCSIPERP